MTRTTNARVAGSTFLLYIAAGVAAMVMGGAAADGTAAKLAHTVLGLLENFSAIVLAVTLYSITRDQDPDLAMIAMVCRLAEGVLGAMPDGSMAMTATFFAVGSTLFAWLLLRGRMIPLPLAWLGVLASLLLVVGLPMQIAGLVHSPVTMLMWLPMAAFEVPFGLWLIIKGVAAPATAVRAVVS